MIELPAGKRLKKVAIVLLAVMFVNCMFYSLLMPISAQRSRASPIGTAWEKVNSLVQAEAGYAQPYKGKIYFIGGSSVQVFEPSTGQWKVVKNDGIGYQPYKGGSAIVGDRIYIVNGWCEASYYCITNNSFFDIPNPNATRLDVAVGRVGETIYVSGGWIGGNTTSTTTLEAYDIDANVWRTVAPMQTGRKDHEMIGVNGLLYAIGGVPGNGWGGYTTTAEKYDPQTDTWSYIASTLHSHREHGLATNGDSILIVSSDCELYDIHQDFWSSAPLINAQGNGYGYFASAGTWLNGYAYSIGGRTAPDNWYSDAYRLQFPASNDTENPIANAGRDISTYTSAYTCLDGILSSDNTGIENYTWSFQYNGSTVSLFGPGPSFVFWTPGNYTVVLNVTDAAGNWATDKVTVTVDATIVTPPGNNSAQPPQNNTNPQNNTTQTPQGNTTIVPPNNNTNQDDPLIEWLSGNLWAAYSILLAGMMTLVLLISVALWRDRKSLPPPPPVR
ncbi:MAG: hypothetical protein HZB92_00485 [Euryarchaeota archaeon]|nr:hypothetical protein [Euryarchaeota archaeon]